MSQKSGNPVDFTSSSPAFVMEMEARYLTVLDELRKAAHMELAGRAGELAVVLLSLGDIGRAVDVLARNHQWNATLIVARAFVERAINICYLLACEDEEYKKYWMHSKQKTYRSWNRIMSSAFHTVSMKREGVPKPSEMAGMEEALATFTGKGGGEATRWTRKSLIDRVNRIAEHTGLRSFLLLCPLLFVYDDASEALHGTLYGCTIHLGVWQGANKIPDADQAESFEVAVNAYNLSVVSCLFFMFCGLVDAILHLLGDFGAIGEMKRRSEKALQQGVKAYRGISKHKKKAPKGKERGSTRPSAHTVAKVSRRSKGEGA